AFASHVLDILRRREILNTKRILKTARGICEEKNVRVEMSRVVEGEAKYAICETADKMGVDLLIVGSRGYGALMRTIIGSVSDYCSHNAKCPV
ncbi:hypothetical protein KI387_011381, partial [Taxus chinensis]